MLLSADQTGYNGGMYYKELTRYISYHLKPGSYSYNSIESIVSNENIENEVIKVMHLLQFEPLFLSYDDNINIISFLKDWSDFMQEGKIVFLCVYSRRFHPVIFDQFIHFRERNSFHPVDIKYDNKDIYMKQVSPLSHLFLLFTFPKKEKIDPYVYEVSDHVLDLKGE